MRQPTRGNLLRVGAAEKERVSMSEYHKIETLYERDEASRAALYWPSARCTWPRSGLR